MGTHKERHINQKINPLYVVLDSTMWHCCGSVQPDFTKYILKTPQWDNSNTFYQAGDLVLPYYIPKSNPAEG